MADENDLDLQDLSADSEPDGASAESGDGNAEEFAGAIDEDEREAEDVERQAADLEPVYDIPVHVSAVLGKTRMQVSELMKLSNGVVVELDRKVGEAIDIYVNNRLVARGEVVVVEERLGVTMTEIVKSERS